MNAKDVIEGILGISQQEETKKEERTIVCRICAKDYTYTVKKGRQPSVCKEAVCDEARKKGYLKPKLKVIRTHTCAWRELHEVDDYLFVCDVEITQHGRGGKKLYCDEHRIAVSQKQHKKFREDNFVSKVREQGNCKDCQKPLGDKTGKGKLRVRCPVCQTKRAYKKSAIAYKPVMRTYTCRVCKKEFEQHGQGQTRKSCKTCKYPIKPTKMTSKSDDVLDDMLDGMMRS